MKRDYGIFIIGLVEIAIGSITLLALAISLTLFLNTKPFNVILFVVTTSLLSIGLGMGLLKYNTIAYNLLVFFALYIILSKILIFSKIIILNGALETQIPPLAKNTASILYHVFILWYLKLRFIKKLFKKI